MTFKEPNGTNFRPTKAILIEEMRETLGSIWEFLSARDKSESLFRYDDWWQHDGQHFPKDKIGREVFARSIATKQEVVESMPGDFNVRIGVCSKEMHWYLRYYVDIFEDIKDGYYDLTVPSEWEKDFEKEVISKLRTGVIKEDAAQFYKSIIEG